MLKNVARYLLTTIITVLLFQMVFAQNNDGEKAFVPKEFGTGTSFKCLIPTFSVGITVNNDNHLYYEGENISFTLESQVDGYYYLINLQPKDEKGDQKFIILSPTKAFPNNHIKAGVPLVVPGNGEKRIFPAQAPFGKETIALLVSKEKLPPTLFGLDDFTPRLVDVSVFNAGIGASESLNGSSFWTSDRVDVTTLPKDGTKPSKGKFGLYIGIGKYASPSVSTVSSDKSAAMVEKTLQQFGYNNTGVVTLINEQATHENIKDAFARLAQSTDAGDEIVIYWGGHGERMAAEEATDSPDGLRGYLMTHNTKEVKSGTGVFDPKTMISDLQFGDMIKEMKDRKILVMLDTCFSGTFIDPKSRQSGSGYQSKNLQPLGKEEIPLFDFKDCIGKFQSKSISQKDAVAISTSSRDEVSWGNKEYGFGTYFLCANMLKIKNKSSIAAVFQDAKTDLMKELARRQALAPELTMQTPLIQGDAAQFILIRTAK